MRLKDAATALHELSFTHPFCSNDEVVMAKWWAVPEGPRNLAGGESHRKPCPTDSPRQGRQKAGMSRGTRPSGAQSEGRTIPVAYATG